MKVIYIAGKYRDLRGEFYVRENIRRAEEAAIIVWQRGGVAFCPHKNTAFFGGLEGCTDQTWLDGDMELLQRCDAMWAIAGWEDSKGAIAEVNFAISLGMPVFHTASLVINYLGGEVVK